MAGIALNLNTEHNKIPTFKCACFVTHRRGRHLHPAQQEPEIFPDIKNDHPCSDNKNDNKDFGTELPPPTLSSQRELTVARPQTDPRHLSAPGQHAIRRVVQVSWSAAGQLVSQSERRRLGPQTGSAETLLQARRKPLTASPQTWRASKVSSSSLC